MRFWPPNSLVWYYEGLYFFNFKFLTGILDFFKYYFTPFFLNHGAEIFFLYFAECVTAVS